MWGDEWVQKWAVGKAVRRQFPRGAILVGTRPQRGGGTPPSTDPKIVAQNNVLCRHRRRRRFCFRHTAGGIFFVRPYVSVLKILRISWRIQKWLKRTKKGYVANLPTSRPLLILPPALKRRGSPRRQFLTCTNRAGGWSDSVWQGCSGGGLTPPPSPCYARACPHQTRSQWDEVTGNTVPKANDALPFGWQPAVCSSVQVGVVCASGALALSCVIAVFCGGEAGPAAMAFVAFGAE